MHSTCHGSCLLDTHHLERRQSHRCLKQRHRIVFLHVVIRNVVRFWGVLNCLLQSASTWFARGTTCGSMGARMRMLERSCRGLKIRQSTVTDYACKSHSLEKTARAGCDKNRERPRHHPFVSQHFGCHFLSPHRLRLVSFLSLSLCCCVRAIDCEAQGVARGVGIASLGSQKNKSAAHFCC